MDLVTEQLRAHKINHTITSFLPKEGVKVLGNRLFVSSSTLTRLDRGGGGGGGGEEREREKERRDGFEPLSPFRFFLWLTISLSLCFHYIHC